MSRTPRRLTALTLTLGLGLGMTACSNDEEQAEFDAAKSGMEELESAMEAGQVWTTKQLDAELEPVKESPETHLLAPGLDLRITETGQLTELSAQDAEAAGMSVPADADKVVPADGEAFYVMNYSSTDPQIPGPKGDEVPESTATVTIEGSEAGTDSLFTTAGDRQQGSVIVSAPEDIAPEDLLLEVTTGQEESLEQSLSIVDGTRTSDSAPQLYAVEDFTAEVTDAEAMSFDYVDLTKETQTIRGEVEKAHLTPYHEQFGFSRSGELYLVVTVDEPENHDNRSTIQVEMPDGTTIEPEDENRSLVKAFDGPMTFSVPADAGEAIVRLTPRAKPATEVTEGEPAEATVTWNTAGEGGSSSDEKSGDDESDDKKSEDKASESGDDASEKESGSSDEKSSDDEASSEESASASE
ncbi:hypothetical protein [Kytococcus sp. Marseille-QA3725]